MTAVSQNPEILRLSQILWDYHNERKPAESADLLLVMGSEDVGVAQHAAELAQAHHYSRIVVSGGVFRDRCLRGEQFQGTEAEMFTRVMAANGVSPAKIILENDAANTGQNITLTRGILKGFADHVVTGQLVSKPMMQRRAMATAEAQWPEVTWRVSSESKSLSDYIHGADSRTVVAELVANTAKILTYPQFGYQTPQPMRDDVKTAMMHLIQAGFTDEWESNEELATCMALKSPSSSRLAQLLT